MVESVEVSARKIPFLKIRQILLKKQEMKLVRNQPDKYFDALSAEQIKQKLRELDHTVCDKSTDDLHQEVKMISRQHHFKMWHDHATIGGYGHFFGCCSHF